jgi:hypothetical protein
MAPEDGTRPGAKKEHRNAVEVSSCGTADIGREGDDRRGSVVASRCQLSCWEGALARLQQG